MAKVELRPKDLEVRTKPFVTIDEKKAITKWLRSRSSKQRETCPFVGMPKDQAYYCRHICKVAFPEAPEVPEFAKTDSLLCFCPCTILPMATVKMVAYRLIRKPKAPK
jgi:hypothetical protein